MSNVKAFFWKDGNMWIGQSFDSPRFATQGDSLEELRENFVDAYRLMMDDPSMKIKIFEMFGQGEPQ